MPSQKDKRKKSNPHLSFLRSNILIVLGVTFILVFLGWRYHQERILSFNTKVNQFTEDHIGIKPVYVKSYPLGIDIAIRDSKIINGVWTINPDSANFLVSSAGLNAQGNTVIYGHNKNEILGPLRWANVDTVIEITGVDGLVYRYKVIKTDTVNSDDIEYVLPTNNEILTIYTCTGFLDSKRFVVVAKRIVDNNVRNNETIKTEKTVSTKYTTGQVKPLANFNRENVYITYYGFDDNDPPGRSIAFPKNEYLTTVHNQASGGGSYDDPVSIATSTDYLKYGTKIYIPYIKKYGIIEDYCASCDSDYKKGVKHIDIWAGGDGTKKSELIACEEKYTRESAEIIIDPPDGLAIVNGPVCF